MKICVFGAASNKINPEYMENCYKLSKALALRGHNLVFGAGGEGVMGAAARGFHDGGAKVHGVIPQFFEDAGYEAVYKGCDEVTRTETMAERKKKMEDEADAFIIAAGGVGTFEEFFEVLTLKQLGRHKKAIVVYNDNGYYSKLDEFIEEGIEKKFINAECRALYAVFSSREEIVEYLENYSPGDVKWSILKGN